MTRESEDTLTPEQEWVRGRLAGMPMLDPGPERVARCRAAVDEAVDAAWSEAEARRHLPPAPRPARWRPAVGRGRPEAARRRPAVEPGRPAVARWRPAVEPGRPEAARRRPAVEPGRPEAGWGRRPLRTGGVTLVAAAVIVALALPGGSAPGGPGTPLVLDRDGLPALAARAVGGGLDGGLDGPGSGSGPHRDSGPLADPVARAHCLADLGVPDPPLGGRPVLLDGRPGVLFVLPTRRAGRLRLLVVAPSCGAGGPPEVLADQLVGP